MAYYGNHECKLDDKGRIVIPAKMRDQLRPGLVLARGQDHCLVGRSAADWADYVAKIDQAPTTDDRVRRYRRMLFGYAVDLIPDKQNRVIIPQHLRDYGGLNKDLVVVGLGNYFEVWDAARWLEYDDGSAEDYADLAREVIPGLI